jgi:hypothetical protein
MLASGPKVHGSKPGGWWNFQGAIRIRSTPSFGGEVNPAVPCRKILWRVKEPYEYERDTSQAKFSIFLAVFVLLRCYMTAGAIFRELWCTNQEFSPVDIILSWLSIPIAISSVRVNNRPLWWPQFRDVVSARQQEQCEQLLSVLRLKE